MYVHVYDIAQKVYIRTARGDTYCARATIRLRNVNNTRDNVERGAFSLSLSLGLAR